MQCQFVLQLCMATQWKGSLHISTSGSSSLTTFLVDEISNKAKKIVGLIYRQFYAWSSPVALLQLYTSLVRPHLEYTTQVWNPHLAKDIQKLEGVQKFALRVCSRQWTSPFGSMFHSLSLRHVEFYKLVDGLFEFPNFPISVCQLNHPSCSGRSSAAKNSDFVLIILLGFWGSKFA